MNLTWVGGGDTEKPRSEAIERASDIPPMRRSGFLPTHVLSLPIDIFGSIQTLFLSKNFRSIPRNQKFYFKSIKTQKLSKALLFIIGPI